MRADTRTRALCLLLALGVLAAPAWAQESVRKGDWEVRGDERAATDSPTFTMCTGNSGAALNLPVRPNLVPYVRVGVGQAQLDRGAQTGVFQIEDRSAALGVVCRLAPSH